MLDRIGWLSRFGGPAQDVRRKQMAVEEQAVVLSTLAESVARSGCRLLEVGTWCGDSAMVLGEIAKRHGGHLYCVDWWKGNVGTDLEKIASARDVFSIFWERVREHGLEDVIIPIRGKSEDVAGILAAGTFDFLYLDGDHRFESIRQDIADFAPLVRPGGVLCGDDCEGRMTDFDAVFLEAGKNQDYFESVHCGVVLAVGRAFPDYSIDYNIWSVVRTEAGWKPTDMTFPGIPKKRQFSPPLMETLEIYNLVRYGRLVYAIPHALGAVDITEERTRNIPQILSAGSVADLRTKIDTAMAQLRALSTAPVESQGAAQPRLVGSFLRFNIVKYKGVTYAIHQSLGPIDLTQQQVSADIPGVEIAGSARGVIVAILGEKAKTLPARIRSGFAILGERAKTLWGRLRKGKG